MADTGDKYEATLIDRLASTTNRLRNLFYINLLLAGAIFYLVYQDPGFVSEKIGPALQTLEPILKVDRHIKANRTRFEGYGKELAHVLELTRDVSLGISQARDAMTGAERDLLERLEQAFNEEQAELILGLRYFHEEYELFDSILAGYFKLDLKATDFGHVAGFALFLYADYWLPILRKGRDILVEADQYLPGDLPRREEVAALDLRRLDLSEYNDEVLKDTVLENLLSDLPEPDDVFESFMIIDTFCTANGLGFCSIQDIEKWQAKRGAGSPGKLAAPGIEVDVTRELLIPASPIILLIAQHLFMMQFRRREVLRQELKTGLSRLRLDLLDESWVLGGLVLNTATVKTAWRRVQSALMMTFLFISEAVPLLAVVTAGYYIFMQIVLGGVIAEEFASGMAEIKETAEAIGVGYLPAVPEVPGLSWEYLWLALAAISGLILLLSLIQLIRDQCREIFATEAS